MAATYVNCGVCGLGVRYETGTEVPGGTTCLNPSCVAAVKRATELAAIRQPVEPEPAAAADLAGVGVDIAITKPKVSRGRKR